MTQAYETKDSGERAQFASGMQRDTNGGKPRFDLLIPEGVAYEDQFLTRCAALMERGARKYDPRNWEKANSEEELARMKESAFRHFMQWMCGEADEDHAAGAVFNMLAYETTALKVEARASLERGLEQSASGEVVDLGDFTQYADEDDEDDEDDEPTPKPRLAKLMSEPPVWGDEGDDPEDFS